MSGIGTGTVTQMNSEIGKRKGKKTNDMSITDIRREAMTEILSDNGITVSNEQLNNIVADFCNHIDMEREMASYQHVGRKDGCETCERLRKEIKNLEGDIEVYKNSVKSRRHCDHVWIEGNSVMYK